MEFHPAANIFPMMTGDDYRALVESIRNGYERTLPIITYQGMILDGRNRYTACLELGIEPPYIEYDGDDPYLYVIKSNFWRRHLSKEQRIEIMQDMRARGYTYDDIVQATGAGYGTVYRATKDVELIQMDKLPGDDGKYRPPSYAPRDYPDPLVLAQESADAGDGLTADEWEKMPDEYLGDCNKQCYGPRWMVKGDVYEYGAYGVYVCSGCGYAYPPKCEPDKVTEFERHYGDDEQEEPEPEPGKPHVSYNTGNNEWYTPAEYIEAARRVMGRIDLDPASSDAANEVVRASEYYTAEDSGLLYSWGGSVWMNPPYASELIGRFCTKLAEHYEAGDISEAIVLVNNATETTWFNRLIISAAAICFPRGRVKFWQPGGDLGAPLQGQAVIYIGENKTKFIDEYKGFGWTAIIEA